MTSEEAKELLDNLIGMVSDNQESDYDTALKMGIEALEQEKEPILNKIRAEIMSKDGLEEALEIIDKYKAESEE